jgi:hypothetical protein
MTGILPAFYQRGNADEIGFVMIQACLVGQARISR